MWVMALADTRMVQHLRGCFGCCRGAMQQRPRPLPSTQMTTRSAACWTRASWRCVSHVWRSITCTVHVHPLSRLHQPLCQSMHGFGARSAAFTKSGVPPWDPTNSSASSVCPSTGRAGPEARAGAAWLAVRHGLADHHQERQGCAGRAAQVPAAGLGGCWRPLCAAASSTWAPGSAGASMDAVSATCWLAVTHGARRAS